MRYSRTLKRVAVGAGTLLATVLAVRRWRSRQSRRRVEALHRPAATGRKAAVSPADCADLPTPVRRYLHSAIPEGRTLVDYDW